LQSCNIFAQLYKHLDILDEYSVKLKIISIDDIN
jgi:hypothetical protein